MPNYKGFSVFAITKQQQKLFNEAVSLESNLKPKIVARVMDSFSKVARLWLLEKRSIQIRHLGQLRTKTQHVKHCIKKGEIVTYERVYFKACRSLKHYLRGKTYPVDDIRVPALVRKADDV